MAAQDAMVSGREVRSGVGTREIVSHDEIARFPSMFVNQRALLGMIEDPEKRKGNQEVAIARIQACEPDHQECVQREMLKLVADAGIGQRLAWEQADHDRGDDQSPADHEP